MPRFAANLTLLFTERPLLDRFAAARQAGFDAVELLIPYQAAAEDLAAVLAKTPIPVALMNTPAPDWTAGDRGLAARPGAQRAFRDSFETALDYARVLKPDHIHIMAGIAEGNDALRTYRENLAWAVQRAPAQSLLIEPINTFDMPGYFLNDFDQAADILDHIGAPNLALQFDAYHAHRITGDVIDLWARHGHRARHVQVASAEGRHEPGPGAIDYATFFNLLDQEGFEGYVAGEYVPKGNTDAGLDWIRRLPTRR